MKNDVKKEIIRRNPTKHKLVVSQGRVLIGEPIDYKILYTEVVPSKEIAKEREKELKEEYKDVEAVSVCAFSM